MSQMITVLGATGSIGKSTLDVLARHPDNYQVFALTANTQVDSMLQLCLVHRPQYAVMVDEKSAQQLAKKMADNGCAVEVLAGVDALCQVASAPEVDQVMAAIVGAAGLLPTLAAAKSGKRVLLANKEALVMSGQLFMEAIKENNAMLLPIDSEHNAIFQSLPVNFKEDINARKQVRNILLTASGGPFRGWDLQQLRNVTPAQAVKHPNWSMGQKISVDSASLMNKGLELIEACWLFEVQAKQIDILVHPESIIHSMVQYVDGSVMAQMGNPDMRTPIAYGLAWPQRMDSGVASLDFLTHSQLNFEAPDHSVFPALNLSRQAFEEGGTAAAILNAANEVAVAAFLREQIPFTAITDLIDAALNHCKFESADSIEVILAADASARRFVQGKITA
ncbi:1-deoxy-D-xylulose-5-phosphate reductoisomerase [Bermanella sp. 47_1433_sub80_T6]|nr:1-deoxy-D-xylulose-5-phosphate reductoisomerase [Bermanella sp. 47_1433_sub80_T6]